MKLPIPILFVCLLFPRPASATPTGWSTNLVAALADASQRQQPVLVYFTASWCGPCKLMARTTLTNEAVVQTLRTLNHVALDLDEEPKLAAQYEIRAVPTFLVLAPAGESVATTIGFQDAPTFLAWLTNGVQMANAAVARQRAVDQKLTEVDEWLTGSESDLLPKAAVALIELCADRNAATRKAANDRLTALGARHPELLLDGLTHPQLAVRIQLSNLLRQQLGAGFEIDPWSDAVMRTNGIAAWRDKLSATKAAR